MNTKKAFKAAIMLEIATIVYNLIEAGVSIGFGRRAGSIALIGFGLDSIIESLSGGILLWRLALHNRIDPEKEEKIEERAEKMVAISFLLLALYVGIMSVRKIIMADIPDQSVPGMVIAGASLISMPLLAFGKFRLGKKLQLGSLVADAKETIVCAFLSAALLIGLGTHYLFGFWLADPIVGLIIVGFLIKEAVEIFREGKDEERKV